MKLRDKICGSVVSVLTDLYRGSDHPVRVTVEDVWETVAFETSGVDFGDKRRHVLLRVAEAVTVYVAMFAPSAGWEAVEPVAKADLAWRHSDGRILCDVVMSNGPRSTLVWSNRTRGRARRLVTDGLKIHGDLFGGVRMVVLAAPARSLLVVDGSTSHPGLLSDSAFWFADPVLGIGQIAELAVGGTS